MGLLSNLRTRWVCPRCGSAQDSVIQIGYGYQAGVKLDLRIGDCFEWDGNPIAASKAKDRLPNGTGYVAGVCWCENDSPGDNCPGIVEVAIEVNEDRIVRVCEYRDDVWMF